jgi:hypothetical protein
MPPDRAARTVALVRLRDDPTTRAYAARRRAEGKSPREIHRCVKRAVARHLFKLLCRYDRPEVEIMRTCYRLENRGTIPAVEISVEVRR